MAIELAEQEDTILEIVHDYLNKNRQFTFEEIIPFIVSRVRLAKININNEELLSVLKGPSSIMTSDKINGPAKLIKEFRKKYEKPVLKAAFIEEVLYVGDINLDALVNLKTKEELIGDVVQLLHSPIRNLIGAVNSGANKIMGVLETLSEKKE